MNDAIIGVMAVLFVVIAYLLGYTTGRYCHHRSHRHDVLDDMNLRLLQQKRADIDAFVNNVRVTGKDVDLDTLRIIDGKSNDDIAGSRGSRT